LASLERIHASRKLSEPGRRDASLVSVPLDPLCIRVIVKGYLLPLAYTDHLQDVQCKALFCTDPRMTAANGGWWDCCTNRKFPALRWENCTNSGCVDKCKNAECFQLQHYYNAKEKYFKFCPKRMIATSFSITASQARTNPNIDRCIKPECEAEKVGQTRHCAARMSFKLPQT
jgi:hypothetical protein